MKKYLYFVVFCIIALPCKAHEFDEYIKLPLSTSGKSLFYNGETFKVTDSRGKEYSVFNIQGFNKDREGHTLLPTKEALLYALTKGDCYIKLSESYRTNSETVDGYSLAFNPRARGGEPITASIAIAAVVGLWWAITEVSNYLINTDPDEVDDALQLKSLSKKKS